MKRRRLLQLGLVGGATLALAGGGLSLMRHGVEAGRLTEPGRVVFRAIGRAVLDGSLPVEAAGQRAALDGLLARLDDAIGAFPAHVQAELSQLLALLSSAPGRLGLAGLGTDWPEASVAQIQSSLQSMRTSGFDLRQQAYLALHDLTGAAYFSDRSTWGPLGYPGPLDI